MRFCVLLLFLTLGTCENIEKSVKTRIHGKWMQTSVLAEISEYLASQDESLFWRFLNLIAEEENSNMNSSRSRYDFGISIAAKLMDSSDLGLLRFSLSSRLMSPRVEVHKQLALKFKPEKCGSWFFVYGSQIECDIRDLDLKLMNDLDQSRNEIFSFDHVHSHSNRTIFIYGDIGSKDFQKTISIAKNLAASDTASLGIRHFYPHNSESHVSLSGYGVELALKNTEYKAVDSFNQDLPENLHGFNFKTLVNLHAGQQKELESLRENLEKMGEIVPLKKWQLKDLGYKTCEKIITMRDIEDIEELLQDFPIHARTISHIILNDTFIKSIESSQAKLEFVENGQNFLAINGRVVTKAGVRLDLFSLIDTIRQEKKIVDEIATLFGEKDVDYTKLLTLVDFSPVDISGYAFDYRDAKPEYLNNLETIMGMYKSLHLLLSPFPPGQVRPISRHIFNVILFTDPFDSDDELFKKIQEYLQSGVYIRFGVVPIFDEKKHGMSKEKAVKLNNVPQKKKRIWATKTKLLEALKTGNNFLEKTGFQKKPLALLNGYPLDTSSPESFDASLAENLLQQTARLQIALYHRIVEDSVKIDEWWLKKETNPDIVSKVNEKIATAFNERKFVPPNVFNNLRYFSENPGIPNANVTTWIITDFGSSSNRVLASNILKSIGNNKVAFIANPIDARKCSFYLDDAFSINELTGILETESDPEADYCTKQEIPNEFLSKYNVKRGDTVVISNGLFVGKYEDFTINDFEYLNDLWNAKGAWKAAEFLNQKFSEDVSISFYSTASKAYQKNRIRIDVDSMIFPPKDSDSPHITITWIANPVSREAQHLISIVKLLTRIVNSKIEIIFNPPSEIHEMPIKRFYRFVASEELEFDGNGSILNHVASFSNLPQKQLLTMSIETNDAWMIEVKQAEYDLDNILLESVSEDVEAVFSLEHILVEGQSHLTSGEPSAGLEIELNSGEENYDTIVMQNLGYFQLKAAPGVWSLRLRNGSSSDKYQIIKVDSEETTEDIQIVIDSFTGKWTNLVVEEISQEKKESSMEKLMKSAKDYFSTSPPSEVVNIFSLASGHLYERFMRIMMVSVMKNTKAAKVKFWLLKNYLSPKFKESIPILAEEYGFEYELVEYKWPKWLHQQTEKQRVMWGYKILFLDVLFPLNVDKIIFVDADQVVRADLLELMDFNLNGAPYGYVPFCESRKEMDGFRFWKTGYWNTHLMGRRYHISALYVVDLKAFRKFSAGDRLRGRYDGLSADPNSLSNLDQDLPNNMIHEVPIKSLPQDWLWCETWCDDKSKRTAKTIDLCNNPLTKEPKLNSAKRIIGEWTHLDQEISNVIMKDEEEIEPESAPFFEKEEL